MLEEAANHFIRGTNDGIRVDPKDGLLLCHRRNQALMWMDGNAADFSNYRKSAGQAGRNPGSVAELSFGLRVTFAQAEGISSIFTPDGKTARPSAQVHATILKTRTQPIFTTPQTGAAKATKTTTILRPNQLLAVAMPFERWKRSKRGQFSLQLMKYFLLVSNT